MPRPWMAPTRRDALDAASGNPTLRCDGCPRRTAATLLVDVRALPRALRGEADYLCDGCWSTLIRTGRIAREDFVRLLGAPDDVVARARTRALAHDPIRRTRVEIPLASDPPPPAASD